MKREYRKPLIRKVEFEYDEQVVASSSICDQVWTIETMLHPLLSCRRCVDNLFWMNVNASY